MNIKLGINWTRSAIALALLSAVFSFTAMAQDKPNTPLDAEAAAALVEELSDGLADLIEDEAQVTAIIGKWNARQDLAGRTKKQIHDLLFADVKSIIKDTETQSSVWANWDEQASDVTQADDQEDDAVKKPDAPVTSTAPVTLTPVVPVTREFTEPVIQVQRLGSWVDGPWTVVGAYFAEFHEAAPICVIPPGSRFSNGPCIKAQELKIPPGSPPEYLCERNEGKGNCMQYKNGWIAKTCKYGYRYFIWRRTVSGAEITRPMGDSLICTSGKTPVPGEPLP